MLKKYLNKLKTSEKISLAFSLFNLLLLSLLLLSINVMYFFIWYDDQKQESLKDINKKYWELQLESKNEDMEEFKIFLLQKDVLIMPDDWGELLCSESVWKKIHDDISKIENAYFYNYEEKTYFIFSKHYEWIWVLKILFDTTPYVKSQIMIIKISFIIILLFIFISYIFWKIFAKYSLRNLKLISKQASSINLNKKIQKIDIIAPENDEIRILADTLNKAFEKIENQSENQKQFITDVSHEFKTPLMIINSEIDLYYKKCEKNKLSELDTDNLFTSIKQNTKKLNKLLETIFLLSRFQDKVIDFNKEKTNLWKYIKTFSENLINLINNKELNIEYVLQKDIFIDLEESTFNILLENIITNAVKFSEKKWKIEIWVKKNEFWIKDNWIWIASIDQEEVWNKFFKSDDKKEWFWVGLFIVKRIINLYKWRIKVEAKEWKWTKIIVNF